MRLIDAIDQGLAKQGDLILITEEPFIRGRLGAFTDRGLEIYWNDLEMSVTQRCYWPYLTWTDANARNRT